MSAGTLKPPKRLPGNFAPSVIDAVVEIPRDVHTSAGFSKWVRSEDFPKALHASFERGEVRLDVGDSKSPLRIPRDVHLLDVFCDWATSDEFPEKLRVAYLQGKVYLDMSLEEIRSHALVKIAVAGVLWNLNVEVDFGYVFTDGVLIKNATAGVSNNPDGVALSWRSLKRGRVRFVERDGREMLIVGSPDWVMEILSDSSIKKDTVTLRTIYHRAKIGEYWLIDARGDDIDFKILYWRKSGYVQAPRIDGWQYSRAFRRSFQLVRRRDRRGSWQYRLLMKQV